MPIQLTPEEIADIKAGKLDILKPITELGLNVRTADQETSFKTNLTAQIREAVRGEEDLPAYKNIESALEKLTGAKKNENEKASEFLARVVGPLQTTLTEKENELKTLRESGDKDSPVVKALQAEISRITKEKDQAVKQSTDKYRKAVVQIEIDAAKEAAKKIPLNIPDELKNDIIELRVQRMLNDYEQRVNDKDEKELVNKKTGAIEVDTTTASNKRLVDVVSTYFDDIKAVDGAQGGTGTQYQRSNQGSQGGTGYAGVKSKQELHESLSKNGLDANSKEFDEAYNKQIAEYEKATGQQMPLTA